MCWIICGIEFVFLFAWPFASLVAIGNYATAGVFFFIALFSSLRTYFNAAIVLEETGTLDLVDGEKGSRRHWQNMSRLSTIVTKVTRSRARTTWMGILCFFLVAFLGLLGSAVTQEGDTSSDFEFTYLSDFEYVQQDDLMYPTCSFGKGLESLGNLTTDMADYAYLAALAYRDPTITQNELNQWFGDGIALDNQTYVDDYRAGIDDRTAVSYKLITFPAAGNLAMVCIRGTTNAWDALTDAQLWAAAAVFQGLRGLLPLGDIWTPILHRMVNIVSWLASESIERVSFYKETTNFVNFLKTTNLFGNIQVTGHSLGGGLSIITGAQTGIAAVALSGPNAILSRESFNPPVTKEALNTLTFNIVPDRDIVPRLDDIAKLNQHIRCTAPINDFVGCHDGRRSLCEIIFTCGTNLRPALCDCTTEFGYPEPTPKEGVTTTFAEACAALIPPP
jgi:lipase ATG15